MSTEDPVKKSDEFDKRLEADGFEKAVEGIVAAAKHYRFTIFLILLIFDLVLSILIGIVAWQAKITADTASNAQALARITCIAGNEAKAEETRLWNFILSFPPNDSLTPEQQAHVQNEVKQLEAFLSTQLAAQEC